MIEKLDEGDLDEALSDLRELLESGSEATPSLLGRTFALEVVCLRALGEDDEALELLERRLEEHADDKLVLLALGIELSDREQLELSEKPMRAVVALDPESEIPRYNLALVLERQGRHDEAVEEYDRALSRAATFAPAACRKAACLRAAGRLEEAATAFRAYLTLEPGDSHEWISLAIVESDLARYDSSYASYERARTLDPDALTLHFNWAITASRRGDRERLSACARELERLAPGEWRTRLARAYELEAAGKVHDGFRAAAEAYDLSREAEDGDVAAAAALSALQYAGRHDLVEPARELARKLFEHETFSDGVLAALRRLEGRRSDRALDFSLLVEGDFEAEDEDEPHRYVRSYRVFARDPDEACELTLDFETRCGGKGLSVRQVERSRQAAPSEQDLGVFWRLASRLVFPAADDDEDEDGSGDGDDIDRIF